MYKPFTIVQGSGPFSKLCTSGDGKPVHGGTVACIEGTGCYVRFLKTATATVSGENSDMSDLPSGATFTDGWAYVTAGGYIPFGSERILGATQSDVEPVSQIDIYIDSESTVSVLQH